MTTAVVRRAARRPFSFGGVAAQIFMIVMLVLWITPVVFALYVALYAALIVAYVTVLKYMAGKAPDQGPATPQSGEAVADAVGDPAASAGAA